ncbi:MAG: LOG family protein [Anaerolineales bacterium]
MNITIFGGAQPQPGTPAYQEAYRLGKMLAGRGHTVLTGGYIGTMEAVSKGASEAGGHVIGVTCAEIENWRPIAANDWVKEERRAETLVERLDWLIHGCDAAIALPGGPGTLTEISLMWNLLVVESIHRRPLILVGEGWRAIFNQVFEATGNYTSEKAKELLFFAQDVESAVNLVESQKSNV